MKQFLSLVIKEAKHIVRDKRTMLMLFGMPIVLMLLSVRHHQRCENVRTVIVTSRANYATQQAVDRLSASAYFTVTRAVATPAEASRLIQDQKADLAVVFSAHFSSFRPDYQLIVDGTDPNMAQQWSAYAGAVLSNPSGGAVNTKLLYNPQMKSAYNFVPAIMGMLLMLIVR